MRQGNSNEDPNKLIGETENQQDQTRILQGLRVAQAAVTERWP